MCEEALLFLQLWKPLLHTPPMTLMNPFLLIRKLLGHNSASKEPTDKL